VLLVLQFAEYVYNMSELGEAWLQSRGVEKWTITPPQSPPRFYFVATLTWSQPTDLDLYTTAPNGEVAWYRNRVISVGELDYDDTDGYGPENFTLRRKLVGRYDDRRGLLPQQPEHHAQQLPRGHHHTQRAAVPLQERRPRCAPATASVACFVDLDDNGRVTVTPVTNAASVRPTDVGRDQVKPPK
jgi:hypothetical protein